MRQSCHLSYTGHFCVDHLSQVLDALHSRWSRFSLLDMDLPFLLTVSLTNAEGRKGHSHELDLYLSTEQSGSRNTRLWIEYTWVLEPSETPIQTGHYSEKLISSETIFSSTERICCTGWPPWGKLHLSAWLGHQKPKHSKHCSGGVLWSCFQMRLTFNLRKLAFLF